MWVGLLLLFTSLGLHAQEQGAERFNVLYLNMEHGLPNNYVDDIFADSDGFVWIATHGGGLMRYDGFSILDFGVGSPGLQLPSNSCRNICEDTFHRLWVSFDEFTAVLDLNTLKPATLTTPRQDVSVQEVLQERSLHVCCDEKGKIWVVTMDNIYCIVFDERGDVKQLYRFATHSNTPDVFIGDLDGDGLVDLVGSAPGAGHRRGNLALAVAKHLDPRDLAGLDLHVDDGLLRRGGSGGRLAIGTRRGGSTLLSLGSSGSTSGCRRVVALCRSGGLGIGVSRSIGGARSGICGARGVRRLALGHGNGLVGIGGVLRAARTHGEHDAHEQREGDNDAHRRDEPFSVREIRNDRAHQASATTRHRPLATATAAHLRLIIDDLVIIGIRRTRRGGDATRGHLVTAARRPSGRTPTRATRRGTRMLGGVARRLSGTRRRSDPLGKRAFVGRRSRERTRQLGINSRDAVRRRGAR